jgi:hypothetical protein
MCVALILQAVRYAAALAEPEFTVTRFGRDTTPDLRHPRDDRQ